MDAHVAQIAHVEIAVLCGLYDKLERAIGVIVLGHLESAVDFFGAHYT